MEEIFGMDIRVILAFGMPELHGYFEFEQGNLPLYTTQRGPGSSPGRPARKLYISRFYLYKYAFYLSNSTR